MKAILFLISIFCFTSVIAQGSEVKQIPIKQSKWLFGWTHAPELSYRILTESKLGNDYFTASEIELRNDLERAKYGHSTRVFCGYRISEMFTLEAGVGYTDFGEGLKPQTISSGANPEPEYATLTGKMQIIFATVPISLRMNLGGKRCQWFVSAGVAPGYKVSYVLDAKIENPNGTFYPGYYTFAPDYNEISTFILEAHISGGVDIQLSEKVSFRIAPGFKLSATDTYSDLDIRANYFNAGIEFGTVFRL